MEQWLEVLPHSERDLDSDPGVQFVCSPRVCVDFLLPSSINLAVSAQDTVAREILNLENLIPCLNNNKKTVYCNKSNSRAFLYACKWFLQIMLQLL